MYLNARVDVNCEWTDACADGQTENQTPISHPAKTGVTKSRSRVSIDGSFELHSSKYMHAPSFMALAIIVPEKMT